jgi:hypothetical protein
VRLLVVELHELARFPATPLPVVLGFQRSNRSIGLLPGLL